MVLNSIKDDQNLIKKYTSDAKKSIINVFNIYQSFDINRNS